MPAISVIIPTYNRRDMLAKAVDSVLAQTWSDFEVIVVDDGSTDGTGEVFANYPDERVHYVRQENAGPSTARNRGALVAEGRYLAYLDSDDTYLPHKLEVQARALQQHPDWGLVAGGWSYADAAGNPLEDVKPWIGAESLDLATWLRFCPIIPSSIVVRREWMERIGGWDLRRGEDYDLGLRLAVAGCRMGWTRMSVCSYTIHGGNYVWDAAKTKFGILAVLDRLFENPNLPADILGRRDEIRARALLRNAPRELSVGQLEEGRADLAEAIRLAPQLMNERGEEIFDMLVAHAWGPFTENAFAYISAAFDALPHEASVLRARKREAISAVAMSRYFAAHSRGDWATALRMLPIGLWYHPRWLRNRGVMSILGRSVIRACRPHPAGRSRRRPASALATQPGAFR